MRIILTTTAHAKIIQMFKAVETEVGALMSGYVDPVGKNVVIQNIYITKQEISAADVDFKEEGVDTAIMQALIRGEVIIGWVHSHGKMNAFWSGVDERSIQKLLDHTNTFLVSIVGNHACSLLGRIDYFTESIFGREKVKVDNVPVTLEPVITPELVDEIDKAIKENVSARVYRTYGNVGSAFGARFRQAWHIGEGEEEGKKADAEDANAPVQTAKTARENLINYYETCGYDHETAEALADDTLESNLGGIC